jgi:hypothetical protein
MYVLLLCTKHSKLCIAFKCGSFFSGFEAILLLRWRAAASNKYRCDREAFSPGAPPVKELIETSAVPVDENGG